MADTTDTKTPAAGAAATATAAKPSILQQLVTTGNLSGINSDATEQKNMLAAFVNAVEKVGADKVPPNLVAFVNQQINAIDAQIGKQLDEILHHSDFQALESTWRGLWYLVSNTAVTSHLKLKVMNATKEDLLKDFEKAVEFDESHLFKRVYEAEYGTYGGEPYSCLLSGYQIDNTPMDMELVRHISGVASASHAPFFANVGPSMVGLDSFEDLAKPTDLSILYDSVEFAKWNDLRETEDSRYVVLTLPRVLMREPYGPDTNPVQNLRYTEDLGDAATKNFLWGSPAWALGTRITSAFTNYNWTVAIRGVEGGGLVEDLPTYTYTSADGDLVMKCPTETAITDRREKELSDLGFLPLCYCKGTDKAAFFGAQTIHKPKIYNKAEANANANLSARITYMMAASRFAHYIKVMMRDKIGSFMSKEDVQKYLQEWIAQYVLLNDNASEEMKSKYPLREARVDVFDVPGNPGQYRAVCFLRPHFQLEELTTSLRLVADLPKAAGG